MIKLKILKECLYRDLISTGIETPKWFNFSGKNVMISLINKKVRA